MLNETIVELNNQYCHPLIPAKSEKGEKSECIKTNNFLLHKQLIRGYNLKKSVIKTF